MKILKSEIKLMFQNFFLLLFFDSRNKIFSRKLWIEVEIGA